MPTKHAHMVTDCYDDKTEITASLVDVAGPTVILHIGGGGFRSTLHMTVDDTLTLAGMLATLVRDHSLVIAQQIEDEAAEDEAFIR